MSAKSWPEADVVGPWVSQPVTVFAKVERKPGGELAHEGNRVPDIVVLDAQHVVVGWRSGVADPRDPTPTDAGSIGFARSADGGRTWRAGTLAAASATHRYHYVIFLRDGGALYAFLGRVAVAEDRDQAGNVDGFPTRMVARRSLDQGATWQDFPITVEVADNSRGVVVAGRPIKYGEQWLLPYWQQAQGGTRAGVLRSADLRTWRPGGLAEPPPGIGVEEPQVVLSQDDPGTLLMVTRTLDVRGGRTPEEKNARYRTHAAHAALSTSVDGGLSWSPMTLSRDIPNFYVKGFFAKDADGRYVAIYNTLAGPFTGEAASKPAQYREVLHYKVKRPGQPWGPGRLLADGTRLTKGAARGWDVYASADEYAPGRFFVVWEHNQSAIKVAKLDVAATFTGVRHGHGGWETTGSARVGEDGIRLVGPSSVTQRQGPRAGFALTVRGSGCGLKVATGRRRLMLELRADGVYASGSRLHPGDPAPHTWRAVVDRRGHAALFRDGTDTGARWPVGEHRDPPQVAVWTAELATVELLEVADNLAGSSWADWTLAEGARLDGGFVRLRGTASASIALEVAEGCDFTVEFRGSHLGLKVANGAKRLMLTLQPDGVWTMRKGSSRWSRVLDQPGDLAVWKVAVDSAGVATLSRDGVDTGASWVVEDSRERPQATHWLSGADETLIEWTLVTATA